MNNLISATTNEAMMIPPLSVANPCINICRMDLAGKYCQGCGRTLVEIGLWDQMTEAQARRSHGDASIASSPAQRAVFAAGSAILSPLPRTPCMAVELRGREW